MGNIVKSKGEKMKKLLTSVLTLALILSCFTFVGCFAELKPYIKVVGLKNEYEIGDALDVGSAKVHYYRDESSTGYSEIKLDASMVSGFSTEVEGTFTMTITYNKLTTTLEYVVTSGNGQGGGDEGGDNSGDEGGDQPGQEVELTEAEAEVVMAAAAAKMITYAEIKEVATASMGYYSATTYQITTKDKRYIYEDEENYSWLVKENGKLYLYKAEYDYFDEVMEYNKYDIDTTYTDVREYQYSNAYRSLEDAEFVKASKLGEIYTIKYVSTEYVTAEMTITIQNNEIKTIYVNMDGITETVQYTYYSVETREIPDIKTVKWNYLEVPYYEW